MADTVAGRRGRGRPERAKPMNKEMQALIGMLDAAGVSKERRAEALSKRYRSVAEQREAIKALANKPSGLHAKRLANRKK